MIYFLRSKPTIIRKYEVKKISESPLLDSIFNFNFYIADLILPLWFQANFITLIGQMLGIASSFLCITYYEDIKSSSNIALLIGILALISWWCDEVDGYWARKTKTSSLLGQMYDHGLDYTFDLVFFYCTLIQIIGNTPALIILITSQIGTFLITGIEHINSTFECDSDAFFFSIGCILTWILYGLFPTIMFSKTAKILTIIIHIILLANAGRGVQLISKFKTILKYPIKKDLFLLLTTYSIWFLIYLFNLEPNYFKDYTLVLHMGMSCGSYILLFLSFKIWNGKNALLDEISLLMRIMYFILWFILPYFLNSIHVLFLFDFMGFLYIFINVRSALVKYNL
jgi:phosphatidylglycerophosphate synthase